MSVPVLLGLSVLVFSMLHLTPGDPVKLLLYAGSDDVSVPPDVLERARRDLGLDRPLPIQYLDFLWHAVRGDLGESYQRKVPVTDLLATNLPYTASLALSALAVALIVGVTLGVIAAINHQKLADTFTIVFAVLAVAMPNFWLGLILIIVFAVQLGWLPAGGTGTWQHTVLPALTLGMSAAAILARLTRSTMLDVLQQDYVRTARAKGLMERVVIYRHALRNALIPIITVAGLQLGALLSGAIVIEIVFARQGIGTLAINAILSKDFNLTQGTILISALAYVLVNLAVDLCYSFVDPRIRY
jgi:peptide/nickel transport system permease protein